MADPTIEEGNHKPKGRVYPSELAVILERTVHTLRQWEAGGLLPRAAIPKRDSRGWRYWTPSQVDVITEWVRSRRPQDYEKLAKLRSERFLDSDPQPCSTCGEKFKDLQRHQRMTGHGTRGRMRA